MKGCEKVDDDDGCNFTCFFRASNSLGRGEAGIEVDSIKTCA